MTNIKTRAPERMWVSEKDTGAVGGCWHDACTHPSHGLVEYTRADLTPSREAVEAMIKPLVWYGKPNEQECRIGRCGQIAYSVRFTMGRWGYTRSGQKGHVVSYKGGNLFHSEADAIDGAGVDHRARILATLGFGGE